MSGYAQAIWRGSPNHYQGRNGYTVDHITLHIMVGSLWGTDSCFQQASFRAASHYGVGTDGTVLQWVDEDNGSWADANMASDCSGVTIEHAGGLASIPVTDEEVEASARLCADISRRHNLGRLWHDGLNGNIYLHREIPGTDHYGCPDNTINGLPVDRVIARANELLEGEDMPSAQEIAQAVWNFNQNGTLMRDRVQGTDAAANKTLAILNNEKTERDWNNSRTYRTMLMLKRLVGMKDNDTTVPLNPVARIELTNAQLDAIADRVAAKIGDNR